MVYDFQEYRQKSELRSVEQMVPPQAVEAEEAVLGGILVDSHGLDRVRSLLRAEMLYITAHQEIYKAMTALQNDYQPVDLMTVTQRLDDLGLLDRVGGKGKLIHLFDVAVSAVNIDAHAQLIVEKWQRRQFISVAQEMMRNAYDPAIGWAELVKEAEERVFAFSDAATQSGLKPLGEFVADEMKRIDDVMAGHGETGIQTGFYDLDAITRGLKPQALYVFAGRPGMGKTALVASISRNLARDGHPIALFSLEMSGGEIARRLISAEAGIDSTRLELAQIQAAEWDGLGHSLASLSNMPLYIDQSQDVTPSSILSQCRLLKSKMGGLGAIVIDYLHLMLDGGDEEVRELSKLTRACKKMARALDTPVILLSQLSRAVEARSNKRPTLADLRGSGAIEQDADLVAFLYRDEYYNPESPDRGIAEIIVAKHRNGATGTIKLLFEPEFTRFRNLLNPNRSNYQSEPRVSPRERASTTSIDESTQIDVEASCLPEYDPSELEEF